MSNIIELRDIDTVTLCQLKCGGWAWNTVSTQPCFIALDFNGVLHILNEKIHRCCAFFDVGNNDAQSRLTPDVVKFSSCTPKIWFFLPSDSVVYEADTTNFSIVTAAAVRDECSIVLISVSEYDELLVTVNQKRFVSAFDTTTSSELFHVSLDDYPHHHHHHDYDDDDDDKDNDSEQCNSIDNCCTALAISTHIIVIGDSSGCIELISRSDGSRLVLLSHEMSCVTSVTAVVSIGATVFVGFNSGHITQLDCAEPNAIREVRAWNETSSVISIASYEQEQTDINSMAFTHHSNGERRLIVIVGLVSGNCVVRSVVTQQLIAHQCFHNSVVIVEFSADAIVAADDAGNIKVWPLNNSSQTHAWSYPSSSSSSSSSFFEESSHGIVDVPLPRQGPLPIPSLQPSLSDSAALLRPVQSDNNTMQDLHSISTNNCLTAQSDDTHKIVEISAVDEHAEETFPDIEDVNGEELTRDISSTLNDDSKVTFDNIFSSREENILNQSQNPHESNSKNDILNDDVLHSSPDIPHPDTNVKSAFSYTSKINHVLNNHSDKKTSSSHLAQPTLNSTSWLHHHANEMNNDLVREDSIKLDESSVRSKAATKVLSTGLFENVFGELPSLSIDNVAPEPRESRRIDNRWLALRSLKPDIRSNLCMSEIERESFDHTYMPEFYTAPNILNSAASSSRQIDDAQLKLSLEQISKWYL